MDESCIKFIYDSEGNKDSVLLPYEMYQALFECYQERSSFLEEVDKAMEILSALGKEEMPAVPTEAIEGKSVEEGAEGSQVELPAGAEPEEAEAAEGEDDPQELEAAEEVASDEPAEAQELEAASSEEYAEEEFEERSMLQQAGNFEAPAVAEEEEEFEEEEEEFEEEEEEFEEEEEEFEEEEEK